MNELKSAVCVAVVSSLVVGCRCEAEEDWEGPLPTATPSSSAEAEPQELSLFPLAREARRGGKYRPPTKEELAAYRTWVHAVAKSGWADRLPTKLPPAGFVGRLGDSGTVWILQELPRNKRGSGLVVLRPSSGSSVLIEAPHTFFDGDTLPLALLAFDALNARALLINTIHRGGRGSKAERRRLALSGESPFDVAHNDESFFAQAHEALLDLDPALTTIQIHGFSDETAPGADAVVSAARTNGDTTRLARALREALNSKAIRTYPDQIDVLGATTNVQAKACRQASAPFFSIELSRRLRTELANDAVLAERFARSLGAVVEPVP